MDWLDVIGRLALVLFVIVGALLIAAALIMVERRLLSVFQNRFGPNRVGPGGSLQIVADMVKIFSKEDWVPPFSDPLVFVLAPAVIMVAVLLSFAVVPLAPGFVVADLNVGVLYFLAMSSMGVYSVVLGGWASNSKYSLLGGVRAAAQMLSYEVFMGLSLMGVVMLAGSFNLSEIVRAQERSVWYVLLQPLGFIVFVIAGMAESRRLPFDLPEAESELVAGFHAEYSGMKFGMFYVGEYISITLLSAMIVVLFFGGWSGPVGSWPPPLLPLETMGLAYLLPVVGFAWFVLKSLFFIAFFILVRGSLPRPRYDQLMAYGWKFMLPLALLNLLLTAAGVLLVPA